MVLVISSPSTASKTFGYGMDVLLGASDMFGWLKLQLRCGKVRCYMTLYQGIWGTRWLCICIIFVCFRTICASNQIMNAPELVTTGYDSLTHGSSLHSLTGWKADFSTKIRGLLKALSRETRHWLMIWLVVDIGVPWGTPKSSHVLWGFSTNHPAFGVSSLYETPIWVWDGMVKTLVDVRHFLFNRTGLRCSPHVHEFPKWPLPLKAT